MGDYVFQLRGCIFFLPCIHNSVKELYSDITQPGMANMRSANRYFSFLQHPVHHPWWPPPIQRSLLGESKCSLRNH